MVAVVGGLGWYGSKTGYFRPKVDQVITAAVARGDLVITVTERGELESSQAVQVNCEIEGGGKLVTILPEGTRVTKGQEVARFDVDVLSKNINAQEVKCGQADGKIKTAQSELEVQKNKAESEIAKADLARELAKIDLESYTAEQGEYKVEKSKREGARDTAKKDLKEAQDSLEFTRSLVKKGLAQPLQLRALELKKDATSLIVQQQEADLMVLETFTRRRKTTELKAKAEDAERELARTKKSQEAATEKAAGELVAAQKTAEVERLELKRLKAQLDKCVVTAPSDGIIIYFNERYWDPNMRVRPGATVYFQQPLFTLPDLDKMQVKLKIHESAVKKVQKEMPATMQMEALSGQVLHGKVLKVASVAQMDNWRGGGVKEYETIVSITDLPPDAGLRPGMTAEVKTLVKTVPDALTVPVQAVTEVDSKHVCYVLAAGAIQRRLVETGDNNEQLIEIKKGLQEGEQVALDARLRAATELKKGSRKASPGSEPDDKKGAAKNVLAVAK